MGFWGWVIENGSILLNATGVVGGLLFTAFSLRYDTRTRRISNLLELTKSHRNIWTEFSHSPELGRILDTEADLATCPITKREEVFVGIVILHLNSVFQAMSDGLVIKPDGLRQDVASFFSLPIPQAVWEKAKLLQDDDFVEFVESCLK